MLSVAAPAFIIMNKDSNAKLPAKVKQAFDDNSGETFPHIYGAGLDMSNGASVEEFQEMKANGVPALPKAVLALGKDAVIVDGDQSLAWALWLYLIVRADASPAADVQRCARSRRARMSSGCRGSVDTEADRWFRTAGRTRE